MSGTSTTRGERPPPLVLVVDDDRDIRETLAELLAERGYRVEAAANGQEAMLLLEGGERPSLVLLDLMMPRMNGWELREQIAGNPELSTIPLVVITAAGPLERDMRAPVLNKPIRLAELLAVVEASCSANGKRGAA